MASAPLPDRIEAGDLVVRRWEPHDAEALHEAVIASIEHLRPWMAWIAFEPLTADQRRDLIEGWTELWRGGGDLVVGVFDAAGSVVGGAGLHRRLGPGVLEVGYWVHVDHLGLGIAGRVTAALTDLAFTVADVDRVEVHHDVANERSRRIPEKLGFRCAGEVEVDRELVAPAETGMDLVWATTRAEWGRLRRSAEA